MLECGMLCLSVAYDLKSPAALFDSTLERGAPHLSVASPASRLIESTFYTTLNLDITIVGEVLPYDDGQ